jgi:hypothetical protein
LVFCIEVLKYLVCEWFDAVYIARQKFINRSDEMKAMSLLATALVSMAAHAGAPTQDMILLSRVLLDNPEIGQKLKRNCAELLTDFDVSQPNEGLRTYHLTFVTSGFCLPITAHVTVVEDMRPTYADGAPTYQTTIDFERQTLN